MFSNNESKSNTWNVKSRTSENIKREVDVEHIRYVRDNLIRNEEKSTSFHLIFFLI